MFNEKTIIYIFTTIVLLSGAFFGIKIADKIQQKQIDIEVNKFLLDMDKNIALTRDNYGKVKIGEFKLPEEVLSICMADLTSGSNDLTQVEKYITIKDTLQSGVLKNLFIIQKKQIDSYYNPFLRLNGNKTLCNNLTEQIFSLRFTGVGNSTMVELENYG